MASPKQLFSVQRYAVIKMKCTCGKQYFVAENLLIPTVLSCFLYLL